MKRGEYLDLSERYWKKDRAAQERVLASHINRQRALEFEREVENAHRDQRVSLVNSEAVG